MTPNIKPVPLSQRFTNLTERGYAHEEHTAAALRNLAKLPIAVYFGSALQTELTRLLDILDATEDMTYQQIAAIIDIYYYQPVKRSIADEAITLLKIPTRRYVENYETRRKAAEEHDA